MSKEAHYAGVRKTYDTAIFYAAGPYTKWQAAEVLAELKLDSSEPMRLADVGGGTGTFSVLLKRCARSLHLTLVEPSAAMAAGAESEPLIDNVVHSHAHAWAVGETGGGERYDRLLLKEMMHHLGDSAKREEIFRALLEERLAPGGRLLVICRPKHGVEYPFWPAALDAWSASQPLASEFMHELRRASRDPNRYAPARRVDASPAM